MAAVRRNDGMVHLLAAQAFSASDNATRGWVWTGGSRLTPVR